MGQKVETQQNVGAGMGTVSTWGSSPCTTTTTTTSPTRDLPRNRVLTPWNCPSEGLGAEEVTHNSSPPRQGDITPLHLAGFG